MGKEDGVAVLADLLHILSFVCIFLKLRSVNTKPNADAKPQVEDDLSVKTQLLLMVSYGLRHLPIFKHPKRYLEAVAKFQHKLPSPFQLDLSHAAGLYKETVAYEFLSRTLVLTGCCGLALSLAWRWYRRPRSAPDYSDPMSIHVALVCALGGAMAIHTYVLEETAVKPTDVAKTFGLLLEPMALFPQLVLAINYVPYGGGEDDRPSGTRFSKLHWVFRGAARLLPLVVWWYEVQNGKAPGSLKTLLPKYAGLFAANVYFATWMMHQSFDSANETEGWAPIAKRMVTGPAIVVAVAGAAYFAADSQGISSVPKLLTALRKVVPQMVAAELGLGMFMLLAGGLFTMTSFYGIFFVYLFRAGVMDDFSMAHVQQSFDQIWKTVAGMFGSVSGGKTWMDGSPRESSYDDDDSDL